MDFIFMLTRQDRTITDCLAILDLILPLKLRHIGFKDVGVDKKTLATLAERIRKSGATTYMEVVSTSPADALNSARVAVELGIDRLLGGTDVVRVQEILGDRKIGYYPFCGFPTGHPDQARRPPGPDRGALSPLHRAGLRGHRSSRLPRHLGGPAGSGAGRAPRPWPASPDRGGQRLHARADRGAA